MDWYAFLIIVHVVGTVLGAGGATFAEIFYRKAMKDGVIDQTEGAFLKTTYSVLRLGMILLVLSGFGFLVLYRLNGATHLLYEPRLWAKITIMLIIVSNALLMQAKKIPMRIGAPVSLVSWYSALIIGAWRTIPASYGEIMTFFFLAVLIAILVLNAGKNGHYAPPSPPKPAEKI